MPQSDRLLICQRTCPSKSRDTLLEKQEDIYNFISLNVVKLLPHEAINTHNIFVPASKNDLYIFFLFIFYVKSTEPSQKLEHCNLLQHVMSQTCQKILNGSNQRFPIPRSDKVGFCLDGEIDCDYCPHSIL